MHEFLAANHDELIRRCKAKVATRPIPVVKRSVASPDMSMFIDQLVMMMRGYEGKNELPAMPEITVSARLHGVELLRSGYSVEQVVHEYSDLCESIAELAGETNHCIPSEEVHTLRRCIDEAMADAVGEFGRQRERSISAENTQSMNERLGCLAHELRNHLNTATLAFQIIRSGEVTLDGATSNVLSRSLVGLRDLVDRSLAEVRLAHVAGGKATHETISVRPFIEDVAVAAALEATDRGVAFSVIPVDEALLVEADRPMLSSAVANLLQNAFKYTRPHSHVVLRSFASAKRVVFEVEDECGGLPAGKSEALFQPFEQASADRTGLGLGLSIARRAIEASGGTLSVRNLPGRGCVFAIDLPRAPADNRTLTSVGKRASS